MAICPVPDGDFCERGLRFGAHSLHENRAGSYRSEYVVFATYFNAGLRVYDLTDATLDDAAALIPTEPDNEEAA